MQAANGYGLRHSRVTATGLGTCNLSRDGGRYVAVVQATTPMPDPTLSARHPSLDEVGTGTDPQEGQLIMGIGQPQ